MNNLEQRSRKPLLSKLLSHLDALLAIDKTIDFDAHFCRFGCRIGPLKTTWRLLLPRRLTLKLLRVFIQKLPLISPCVMNITMASLLIVNLHLMRRTRQMMGSRKTYRATAVFTKHVQKNCRINSFGRSTKTSF